ncbi:bifunctional DNA-binding transcriptional regulator/antitoxin component of YhaV-PrlF toxin-antitoxin module [Fictibacillus halophilus]|uniref:Bifunctional DNA-binding transcriptional regulator/antitoxin component of YhaV-PrlF toxin-antitoxin module n=1 Tax=Fictibacillus halophilus TaxID=1610490 RepID=A0ABV2LI11_9BACL|nr:AbrB/MazE/SpoVT family DNA-binding domain-containing protein [Fictibacillus halophilus]
MNIEINKNYSNEKGYFYLPAVWREEFRLQIGQAVEFMVDGENIMISKNKNQSKKRVIGKKGMLTIPHNIRMKLNHKLYKIFILQKEEKILLTPLL